MTPRATSLVFLLVVLLGAGCSSVPVYRPPIPLPQDRRLEVGVGPTFAARADVSGVGGGGNAWVLYRTDAQLDFFGSVHGVELVSYEDGSFVGPFAGGGAGLRMRTEFLEDIIFAGEVGVDFLEDRLRAADVRYASGLVRLPVAQRVVEGVWVYAAPTLGISVPLYEAPPAPFFGISEVPFGVSWTVNDLFTLVAEGGIWGGTYAPLGSAGYFGVSLMAHPF